MNIDTKDIPVKPSPIEEEIHLLLQNKTTYTVPEMFQV